WLPQEPDLDPHRTVLATAAEGVGEVGELLARHEEVSLQLSREADPGVMEILLARQAALGDRIEAAGGWDARHRVERMLSKVDVDDWERPMEQLSGGEARRVALARTLLGEPDLLLLDEPTNHLDARTVEWLEETLFDFRGAVLVITHDRYFLDRVVDRMLEVSPLGVEAFQGGYTEYLEERASREERAAVAEHRRQKRLDKELEWARRSPPARTGKQKARRARAREMEGEQRERDRTRERQAQMEMSRAPRLGRTILEARGISKAYDGRLLFEGVTESLRAGERIGIVGPNGAGKTTLLRVLLGEVEPDTGEVVHGTNTRIGYYDQTREVDPELSVARAVADADQVVLNGRPIHLRSYLERFLFPTAMQDRPVGSLSGGERNRVLLARLFLEEVNVLVLDEPTNDLDLDTLGLLEEQIEAFPGVVLLVTHDRYLLDRMATSLLVFEGAMEGGREGYVHRHHGGWDSWLGRREGLLEQRKAEKREAERARKKERAEAARMGARAARKEEAAGLSWKEEREMERLEGRIQELEDEKRRLEARLADPELYRSGEEEAARVTREHREVLEELEAAEERWMELGERAG
ncbi:MAG: ABC transporter ATP-binding protein, partial [Gemmatimonadales bacterium]